MRNEQNKEPLPQRPEIDPDQLLKSIELQLLTQRRDSHAGSGRLAFRVGSLAFILIATLLALLALHGMLAQMPRPQPKPLSELIAP